MATNDKLKILYELGEASQSGEWPDYLQYGFDESDVSALLALVADKSLNNAERDSNDIWVPLHAWRTLGQLRSPEAISPLIALFEELVEDDWALEELPKVMGMIGQAAIGPLSAYLKEPQYKEFSRVMAVDGLANTAKQHPNTRDQVIQYYQDYMQTPDETTILLNGLLIAYLLDLKAKEAITDIRQFFEKGCVDITCAGDLEDVEIELGFRTERSTPKPDIAQLYGLDTSEEPKKPSGDDVLEIIDYTLLRYGHDDSILDVSEMDGFLTALACAPETIMPSEWMPAIWGGEELMPEWESNKDVVPFTEAVFKLYNQIIQSLNEDDLQALFHEREVDGKIYSIVDEWCNGFIRGINLWGPLTADNAAVVKKLIQPQRLFVTEAGFEKLETMDENEVEAQQQLIEPNVRNLFQHFLKQRKQAITPIVRDKEKIGRNDPCFCGSGKKFKKCCLH